MYYPWWGGSRLGMDGKLIFSYLKLRYMPHGELTVPSTAEDLATTLLPPGAATRPGPKGRTPGSLPPH